MQVFVVAAKPARLITDGRSLYKTAATVTAVVAEPWQWSIAYWVLTASAFGCSLKKKLADRLAAALQVTD